MADRFGLPRKGQTGGNVRDEIVHDFLSPSVVACPPQKKRKEYCPGGSCVWGFHGF